MLVRLAVALGVILILLTSGGIADARGITSIPFGDLSPRAQIATLKHAFMMSVYRLLHLNVGDGWCGTVTDPLCTTPDKDIYYVGTAPLLLCISEDGEEESCQSARNAAEGLHRVWLHDLPSCDANPTTSSDRPSGPDMMFAGLAIRNLPGIDSAKHLRTAEMRAGCYLSDYGFPQTHVEAALEARARQGRHAFAAWDLSLQFLGIRSLGVILGRQDFISYADQGMVYLFEQLHRWNLTDTSAICIPDGEACRLQAVGRLVMVIFLGFGDNHLLLEAAQKMVTDDLAKAPMPHGTTQRHVHRMWGMVASRDFSFENRTKIIEGTQVLLECQLANGGFFQCPGDVEFTFVDEEAAVLYYLLMIYFTELHQLEGTI